jgi:hypothetical protein
MLTYADAYKQTDRTRRRKRKNKTSLAAAT